MTQTIVSKSNTPLQATGHQSCNAASSGVFDPRGSRQISMQAWLPGSLLAGIKMTMDGDKMKRGKFFWKKNQYRIAACCVIAAVVGMTGMYVTRSDSAKQPETRMEYSVGDASGNQSAEQNKTETKQQQAQVQETEQEQTAKASAVIEPKDRTQTKPAKKDNGTEKQNGTAGQADRVSEKAESKTQKQDSTAKAEEKSSVTETASAQEEAEETVATAGQAGLHFDTAEGLLWPVSGTVILDYSMDKTIYFTTLDQYKYNPAVVISGNVNEKVLAAATGKITDISSNEVTGCTVSMDLGDGYTAVYGQLKEVPYHVGAVVEAGNTIGFVGEPTKYYALEGSNVYFELQKDGIPVDPTEFFAQ